MNVTIENNDIAAIINRMGCVSLYGNKSSYALNNAQLNLEGRTHFASDSSLKYFGSRINSAHETASGLLFYIIESSFLDFDKTKRGFRYAIFDIFGDCVARLDIEAAFKTSEQARKAMYVELNNFDVAAHYTRAIESVAKRAEAKAKQYRETLAILSQLNKLQNESENCEVTA